METPSFFRFVVFYGNRSITVRVFEHDALCALCKARKRYGHARKVSMI